MTKAAQHFGKEAKEFTRLPSTQDYVRALSEAGISHVTISKKGYHLNPEVGTWGHPKLAVFFARWLDVKFAVWCDMITLAAPLKLNGIPMSLPPMALSDVGSSPHLSLVETKRGYQRIRSRTQAGFQSLEFRV